MTKRTFDSESRALVKVKTVPFQLTLLKFDEM